MKINFFLGLLFFALFIVACEENVPQETEPIEEGFQLSKEAGDLYQIVGEVHDTAMLLMRNIEKTRTDLRGKMNQASIETVTKDSILGLLLKLKKADDGMMNWMREFKNIDLNEEEYLAWSEAGIMAYLQDEKTKIEGVHVEMMDAIANGRTFLGE